MTDPASRFRLFQLLADLPPPQFEGLLFALNIPSGNIPASSAPQAERVRAVLVWAESPIGCGLKPVAALARDMFGLDAPAFLDDEPATAPVIPAKPAQPPAQKARECLNPISPSPLRQSRQNQNPPALLPKTWAMAQPSKWCISPLVPSGWVLQKMKRIVKITKALNIRYRCLSSGWANTLYPAAVVCRFPLGKVNQEMKPIHQTSRETATCRASKLARCS
jgi:hypothetical protein